MKVVFKSNAKGLKNPFSYYQWWGVDRHRVCEIYEITIMDIIRQLKRER